jgi:pimeloyl-ACP methyl ester carboxylesterase
LKTDTLPVPGANLYHEVRGNGPVLLLICGGIYDAAGYAALAEQLADRYTVVTYDRRGNSRSPLEGPRERQRIEVHADDAHRLLAAVGVGPDQPAYVFGNSSGAEIALELATRHPEQVRVVVAHEPPVLDLLPDRDNWRALIAGVEKAFREQGAGPAMQAFAAGMAMNRGDRQDDAGGRDRAGQQDGAGQREAAGGQGGEPGSEALAAMGRMQQNIEFFIGYEVPPFAEYLPDIAALRAGPARVVAAAGAASAGEPPHRAALALAERLGTPAVVFPGDHGGFGAEHVAFAATLHGVLSGS